MAKNHVSGQEINNPTKGYCKKYSQEYLKSQQLKLSSQKWASIGEGIAEGLSQKNSSFAELLSFSETPPFAGVIFMSIMFSRNGVFLPIFGWCC